ncbi:hypothetical protein DLAC_02353 [Tieghemostelium lacteum]|uniref:Ribosomal protein L37 n=1 Tax=Tieghemostelium lacteum TaxID=361077 RepID=A0A152A4U4_TIELA|nr:hypothetical protein DLAC_02353 [Tieghemostelium lacteum]|eukprot:KYR01234.1 hypothetical protein DLAC_02353 [Tieghemostelium lacteum]
MSSGVLSIFSRRSVIQLTNTFLNRAADPKAKAGASAASSKKKPGAVKKKRFDRGNDPLQFEKMAPTLFNVTLPGDADSEYPQWLFEIEDQLPRDQPVKLLTPEDGQRYFKQQSRKQIKSHNSIMLLTKGRGL